MATTKFKGQDIELLSTEIKVGYKAPEVTVVNLDSLGDVVVDKNGIITYKEIVPKITEEPNYDAALEAVK
jgi:peroxiredoxin